MKMKMIFIIILFLLGTVWSHAESIYVENYSFEEPGSGKIQTNWDRVPGWDSDTDPTDSGVESDSAYGSTDGDWSAFLMASDPSIYNMTEHVITAGATYTLKVDLQDNWSPDGTTTLFEISLYYEEAGDRITVASATVTPVWPWSTFELTFLADDAPDSIGNTIGIELDNVTDPVYGENWVGMDNVRLDMAYVALVSPGDDELHVPIDTNLEWTVANDWDVDVYMSGPYVDPNDNPELDLKQENVSATIYDPPTDLVNKRWYYWRIDAREPSTVDPNNPDADIIHEGPIWAFKTISISPEEMTISPAAGQSVQEGNDATFTAGGLNVEFWTWYKEGVATPLTDGAEYAIDANELTILNADIDDEGFYYCVGTNSVTSDSDQTDPARLLLKRLIGHWKLDYNLEDSVTDVWPTADAYLGNMTDPNYVAGLVGTGAIDILTTAEPYRYITVSDTDDVYNFYTGGMTVLAWIKTTETGWGAIASKAAREVDAQIGWVLEHEGDTVYMTFRGGGSTGVDGSIADGQWHLVAGTYDPETGITSVYASYVNDLGNAQLVSSSSGENRNFTFAAQPLMIGMETNYDRDGDFNGFLGQIDDVQIYSYPLSTEDIAQMYLGVQSGWICNVEGSAADLAFDLNGNCEIDFGDVELFVVDWLNSNRIYAP